MFISGIVSAQHTGSYDTSITFMGKPRKVSLYVPTNYNASNKYRLMICLHGLGDNCANYRNSLMSILSWNTYITNTIFVCPEADTTIVDYYDLSGSEQIIPTSVSLAKSLYTIDTTNIILQGFSLGGRAALRYGLSNYTSFKGLLLNTPAIQGVKNAINLISTYTFDYQNASKIPIYITHGELDPAYEAPIDSALIRMMLSDGKVRKYEFANMGHAIPPITGIINFLSFFDTAASKGYDLGVEKVITPLFSCSSIQASVLVCSLGQDTIKSVTLQYINSGNTLSYTWNGTLAPFHHAIISLPSITSDSGYQSLVVQVKNLNGNITDTVTANNSDTGLFTIEGKALPLPVFEGFEEPKFPINNWVLSSYDDYLNGWSVNTPGLYSANSITDYNTIFEFDNSTMKDDLLSPEIDLSAVSNAYVHFYVSYNYDEYTPPYATGDLFLADTLQVLISTDCGQSFQSLYKKGGSQLATFASPIINPLSIQADIFNPADSNWRGETIDISSYIGNNVIIKFSYISDLGGLIYLDNIGVNSTPTGIKTTVPLSYKIYPNPATDYVYIQPGSDAITQVNIMDMTGKSIFSQYNAGNSGSDMIINTSTLNAGMYIFQVTTLNGAQSNKVMIER